MPYVATLLGTRQVYPGRYKTGVLLRLIEEDGVTFSHCVVSVALRWPCEMRPWSQRAPSPRCRRGSTSSTLAMDFVGNAQNLAVQEDIAETAFTEAV